MNPVSIASASDIQTDYMKLLVAELQNQNPLEPLDNKEMASQLAQFSQLEQLESMNNSFAEILASVQRAYAGSLLGKQVSFPSEDETGSTDVHSGRVEQVLNGDGGQIAVVVDGDAVAVDKVMSIRG